MTSVETYLEKIEDIEAELRTLGVKGLRGHANKCPIASLLRVQFPGMDPYVYVNIRELEKVEEHRIPFKIHQFIAEFDAGQHSEFQETPS